jgi:hypothetical protein
MARTARKAAIVADICLYGTSYTGAGYLGVRMPHGQTFGTGDPVKERSFSEAIWHGLDDLRRAGVTVGLVRVFDTGGERMSIIDINSAIYYGAMQWQPAPVYTISAAELERAAE